MGSDTFEVETDNNHKHMAAEPKTSFLKRLFLGWLAVHIVICVSVFVFYHIEGDHEQKQLEHVKEAWEKAEVFKADLEDRLNDTDLNITSDDIQSVIDLYLSAQSLGSKAEEVKWTPIRTFSFTHEYLSTIGFGQVVPETVAGKYATVFLGFLGIPLYVFNVFMWGKACKNLLNLLLLPLYKKYKKTEEVVNANSIEEVRIEELPSNLVLTLLIVIFCLLFILEVLYFMSHQNLEFHDSLYMSFAMVTSVGFGDFAPEYNEDILTMVLVAFVVFLPFVLQAAIVGELVRKMERGREGWRYSNQDTLEVIRRV